MLSIEIISEFLTSPDALTRGASGGRAPAGDAVIAAVATALLPLAQGGDGFVRDRAATPRPSAWRKNDTVCFGWAIDNFDRYVTPTARAPRAGAGLGRASGS